MTPQNPQLKDRDTIIQYQATKDLPKLFIKKNMVFTKNLEFNTISSKFYNDFIMWFWIENTPELFVPYQSTKSGTEDIPPNDIVLDNSLVAKIVKNYVPKKLFEKRYREFTQF